MASQTDVRYINAYVSGTAAYFVKPKTAHRKSAPMPRFRAPRETVIAVDPVAVFGIVVAAVMIFALLSGFMALNRANEEARSMEAYVTSLEAKKLELQTEYDNGYDLEQVQQIALTMGMVSKEQVTQLRVEVTVPEETPEPTAWDNFCTFLTGLFA